MKIRIEVWYNNGLFRGYPHVIKYENDTEHNMLRITFGEHEHDAIINLNNVNFYEIMKED